MAGSDISTSGMEEIRNVLASEAKEIQDLYEKLDKNELAQIIGVMKSCTGKIILTGCGTSGTAARKIAHTLNCVECPALFLSPAEALHGGMGMIRQEDIVILITKGGQSFELEEIVKGCTWKDVTTVAVTENKDCRFARNCKMALTIRVSGEPDALGMLATASTLAVIAVFDAISIYISKDKNYTKESFLLNHPGGAVGLKLGSQIK